MDRRTHESPMDWEYEFPSGPIDPNSPSISRSGQSRETMALTDSRFADLERDLARRQQIRDKSDLKRRFRYSFGSSDEDKSRETVALTDSRLADLKRDLARRQQIRDKPDLKKMFRYSFGSSEEEKSVNLPDASPEPKNVSDLQRPNDGKSEEAITTTTSNGEGKKHWTPGVAVLTAVCVKGGFYYQVVAVSISAVWIYSTLVFPQSRRLKSGFPTKIGDLARLAGLFLLILWCVMLSPVHILIPTPMDAWTRYSDHPAFRSFEVLHDLGDSSAVDVFAIHGLGSNPSSAWRYVDNGTEVHWLRDLLPKQKGLEDIRVTMLNHQTRWDSHSPQVDFDVFAKMMLDDIEHIHQPKRPIIFIAHSFGGLLLKKVDERHQDVFWREADLPMGILFLGVPHYGTKAAFVASLLACTAYWRGSSTTMLEYMSESNPEVAALDKEFYEMYARPSRNRECNAPHICNFLEMRPERFGKLSLNPTVNINSGRLHYVEDVFLDTDHRGLNKFQSSDDPNFEKFLRQFRLALRHDEEREVPHKT
ncbi:hypothetical protein FGRMN_9568 [Fusarium graminum]|nr:hypothetical protein FGRMN_9568 [Fusarium graminum]